MSLSSLTHVELRTAGNDSNGGGVVPRFYGQDLTSDGSGGVHSAGAVFVAGDVGHSIFIFAPPWSASGWAGGLYTINSVSGGNVATLNASPGANLVGGVFYVCSGLDYSYQNAAQYTFTDLASANGNAASPVVTSASHNFVQNDVGNLIQITAGTNWTPSFYQIVSVAANAATLDRAVGTVAALSGGTYAVGGALLTLTQAFVCTTQVAPGSNNANGATIWKKSGTYTVTATVAANSQQYTHLVGYDATRGDDTGNRPLLTTATSSITLLTVGATGLTTTFYIDNVSLSTTAATPFPAITPINTNGVGIVIRRCKFSGFLDALSGDTGGTWSWTTINCTAMEIANSTRDGIQVNGNVPIDLVDCYIHGCANIAFEGVTNIRMIGCILDGNHAKFGSAATNAPIVTIDHCAFLNSSVDGLSLVSAVNNVNWIIDNSIFWGNGGLGLNLQTPGQAKILGYNNAFGNNTTGPFANAIQGLIGNIYLTANPFTSASDYTLNNAAGGGALLIGKGYPAKFNAATTKSDVGAIQNPDTSAPTPYAFVH